MAVPTGLTRDHVLKAIADLDRGAQHPFGVSRRYDVVFEGRRYSPKAVLGRAILHLSGAQPAPTAFTGGDSTNEVLRRLGFEIVAK
jgi:5-methylcytosine-specific restriction protein A